MQRKIVPKNRRSKRALDDRAPKVVENPKQIFYIHGAKCPQTVQNLFKDLHRVTSPLSKIFSRKHDIRPFEDAVSLENMSDQHDAALFVLGSSNKKRPDNLTFIRMFDHHVLDMVEFGAHNIKLLNDFKNEKNMLGSKPCLVFQGSEFETDMNLKRVKLLLADYFRGPVVDNVNLAGLDHVISFTSEGENKILMRHYRIDLKKSGSRLPIVEVEEIGPSVDLELRRTQWASEDLMKQATKIPRQLKPKKVKNISYNSMGDKTGSVHLEKQELQKIVTRKMKGLKRKKGKAGEEDQDANGAASDDGDESD